MDDHVWKLAFTDSPEIALDAAAYALDIDTVAEGDTPRLVVPHRGELPSVRVYNDGNVVHVNIEWDGDNSVFGWLKFGRRPRISVFLPKSIRGRVHTEAGTVRIRDLDTSDLAVDTGAGAIQAGTIEGRVQLSTSAGSIHVDDISGAMDLRTDAGSIRARIRSLDAGRHEIHSGAGSVRIEVAQSVCAFIEPDVAMGHARIDVPSTPGAPAILSVGSGAGTVSVRPWLEVRPETPHPYRTPPRSELERVLEMVADKRLTPDEASEILRALGEVG